MARYTHVARTGEHLKTIEPVRATSMPVYTTGMKPRGFWYEVDGGWRDWCASEQPDWIAKKPVYEVTFGDEKILRLTTKQAILDFQAEYGFKGDIRAMVAAKKEYVDWERLAEEYDGFEIAPYYHGYDLRFMSGMIWYYAWDCASGCLWRPKGASLRRLGLCKKDGTIAYRSPLRRLRRAA